MNGLYPQSVALADVGCSRSVKTTYLVTPRASMLCFVLINSVLLNLLRVWTKHSVHETVPEAMQCYCQLPPDPTDNSRTRRIFTHKRSERTCDTLTSGRDQYPVKQNCVRHNRLRPRWRRWQIHSPPPFFFFLFFPSCKTTLEQRLNGEKWDVGYLPAVGWSIFFLYHVFVSSAWNVNWHNALLFSHCKDYSVISHFYKPL